jgi:hypothetical protein
MTSALVIIALFFVIGIVFGAVIVVALSILRRDVGPPDGPDDPGGPSDYGPPGPDAPPWDRDGDAEFGETGENSRWRYRGRR